MSEQLGRILALARVSFYCCTILFAASLSIALLGLYAYFMFIVCNNIHNPEIAVAFRAVNLIHAVHSRANDSSDLGSLCFEEVGMDFHGYEWIVRKQNKEETYNVYDLVQTSRSLQGIIS